MNLDEKKALFSHGALTFDEFIKINESEKYSVKTNSRVTNLYFEKNISLDSYVLPTKDLVFLGAYSYMNEGGYIRGPVFIGRYCSIGRRVSIGAGMHSLTSLSSHPLFSSGSLKNSYSEPEIQALQLKERRSRSVYIGSDVWIGDGVVIIPGVVIGDGSVIGANSVVTKDVPPYSIVGGVPSNVLRLRFPEDISSRLLGSKWWDLKLEKLHKSNYKNVYKFLDEKFSKDDVQCYATISFNINN